MARSRSASFSDDDLAVVSSQAANMTLNSSPSKSPLRPIQPPNGEVIDISSSPMGTKQTSTPVFGMPTQIGSTTAQKGSKAQQLHSMLYRKEKSIFNPNKSRPEHHRDHKIAGPVPAHFRDQQPAPRQAFSSLPPTQTAGGYPLSSYHQQQNPGSFADLEIYTDPNKASADLKALLEGGMEDDDDNEGESVLEDGSLEGIKVKLLPHQVEGVEWMRGRELGPVKRGRVPKGGILADDMGLGKTLQSISLIISNPKPKHDEPGFKKHYDQIEKTTLVVAPLALIRQWEAEIKDKVSSSHRLNVYVHHGPGRTKRFQDLARYDVVITTYQILVSEHGHSSDSVKAGCFGLHWYRVILDEAHSIKNRNAKATKACCALRAEFRWCLTGTPMQNNLDELQSLVNFLRIGPYDNLAEWRAHIDQPMKNGKGHIAIRRLHSLLRCFMKRRTKEILKEEGALHPGGKKALDAAVKEAAAAATNGDADGAAPAPPPKAAFRITERKIVTVSADFSPAEKEFYDNLEARADKSLERMMKSKLSYANALVLLLRLRQACNHPKLVESSLDKDKDALSTDAAPSQKKAAPADDDIDALADALGGMGIKTKQCDVCMSDLSRAEQASGQAICTACAADRDRFKGESPEKKRSKKKKRKDKVKKIVKEEVKVEEVVKKEKRKQRNRRLVVDSDDEEEEEEENGGRWLVPEDQRGSLRLGKAGGEEDENAEGGGEWLNSEDSIHRSEDEENAGSRLDSFIVDDEGVKGEEDDDSTQDEDEDDDDSFASISKMHTRVVKDEKKASHRGRPAAPSSDSEDGSGSDRSTLDEDSGDTEEEDDTGISESEFETDDDNENNRVAYKPRKGKGRDTSSTHVLASAKIREVLEILRREAVEHKFIVFSQFTSMLDLVEPFLRKEGLRSTRYDGQMKNDEREASLERLRHDPRTRVLLCSLKCGSLGLNLTAATRVVILEPFWNPFVEEQAIDRVHRLTQTRDVTVYKLTVAGTVEERILELQERKRLLAEQTIEGAAAASGRGKKNAMKLGLREILELFRHDGREADAMMVSAGGSGSGSGGGGRQQGQQARPGREPDAVYGRRW